MNIKWMIIAGIFVVLLVVFGHNPVASRRAAKEASLKGKDRLVESIKEYNTKPTHFGSSLFGGSKSAAPESDKVVTPAPARPIYPNYPANTTIPQLAAPVGNPQQPAAQQPQGYYPPPPEN
jgi:hypothetical protein